MQIINLDLQKKDGFNKAITARRGESGWQFGVRLFDGGLQYTTTSGDKFAFKVTTPSGNYAKVDATYANGMVTVTLNSQITSEAGYYRKAYIEITNGSKIRTTQDIIFFSLGNSDISAGQAHYYVSELDKLLKQLNDEFDEWLVEREKDYTDLLTRVNQLANRITGLDTKLDDIIAQLQKVEINTTNVLDTSLLTQPENSVRRRVNGQTIDIRVWGAALFNNEATIQMFEPNKTYHAKYIAELLTLTGGNTSLGGHFGLALYSGKTGFPTVWIVNGLGNSVNDLGVGDKVNLENTFTTPTELHNPEANYQILGYGRRDNNSVIDAVRFHDIMIQEGSMFTGYQNNPNNTLTRFDEDRLKRNLHPDPKMTGTIPIKNKDTAIDISYDTNGWLLATNTDTAAMRRFWYDPTNELNIPADSVTRPLAIAVRLRATLRSTIMIGYSSGENITYTSTGGNDWVWLTGIIKPTGSTGVSVYISPNANCIIDEFNIYFADITQSSQTLNRLPEVIKATIDTPDTLTNPDANTLTKSGRWKIYDGRNMPPLTTSGTNYYWYFEVINFDASNCVQHAYARNGANLGNANFEYTRQQINGTWGAWQRFSTEMMDGNNFSKTGVNLNDEKIGGKYIYINPTSAPKSGTFYGEVIRYGGAYVMQRLTNTNATDETFQRVCINTAWQPWRKVSIVPASGNVNQLQSMDFNTVVATGSYMNVSATLNCPNNETGSTWYLEVIKYSDTYLYQRATKVAASNATYDRQFLNGTWQPWQRVPKEGSLAVPRNGIDLDTVKETAVFVSNAAVNAPIGYSGTCYVEVISYGSGNTMQRVTLVANNDREFTRQCISNVWTPWRETVKGAYLPPVDLTYKAGWRNHNEGTDMTAWNYARAERRGDTVWVYGAVSNTVDYTPSATPTVVATLPEGYRPKYPVRGNISRSSGRTMFTLEAQTDGGIMVGTMVDPGVNGYANKQSPGKIFHISMSFPAEDL